MLMDELEILKKDWIKNANSFTQITEKEIYGMVHKKSSSIVKWILVISILEIAFWSVLGFFTTDENYFKILKTYHLNILFQVFTYVNYAVIITFIYLFYKNYKKINTTETVKSLMQNILKTRKTVTYYVWYNIIMTVLSLVVLFIFQVKYDPNLNSLIARSSAKISPDAFFLLLVLLYVIIGLIIVGIVWLFYKVIYGILLKRLKNNYKELEKLDL